MPFSQKYTVLYFSAASLYILSILCEETYPQYFPQMYDNPEDK